MSTISGNVPETDEKVGDRTLDGICRMFLQQNEGWLKKTTLLAVEGAEFIDFLQQEPAVLKKKGFLR